MFELTAINFSGSKSFDKFVTNNRPYSLMDLQHNNIYLPVSLCRRNSYLYLFITRNSYLYLFITCDSYLYLFITCDSYLYIFITCDSYLYLFITCDSYLYLFISCNSYLYLFISCDSYLYPSDDVGTCRCTVCVKKTFHTAVFNHRRYCMVQTVA